MKQKYLNMVFIFLIFLAIVQIYLYTTFPAFKNNDSPETIVAAYTLGISHPPGYPLYSIAAKMFSLIPVGSPAFRINIFSIFLSILVLLVTYFTVKKNILLVFGYENRVLNYFSLLILGGSMVFWNQAIEAKGGIYMLNLLFLSLLLYLSTILIKSFNIRLIYLMSLIYGLSLANHWPSMIILSPVFLYFYFKYNAQMTLKNSMMALMFLVVGISPYIYLPIRAINNPVLNIGDPVTWNNFWWTVLRSGYNSGLKPSMEIYTYQLIEFLKVLSNNTSILWVAGVFGLYCLFKKERERFLYFLISSMIIIFAVVIVNLTYRSILWQIDIFLLPFLYIFIILTMIGINYINTLLKARILKYALLVFTGLLIVYNGFIHFRDNNSRYDFLAYDFGNNILKTFDGRSTYFAEGDFFLIPILYSQIIEKKRPDVKVTNIDFMTYKWGLKSFEDKDLVFRGNDLEYNFNLIVRKFMPDNNIYKSNYSPTYDSMKSEFVFEHIGLISRLKNNYDGFHSGIYKTYSHNRGKDIGKESANAGLMYWYPFGLMMQANELLQDRKPLQAKALYEKALLFPDQLSKGDIYYNLSIAYGYLMDVGNQLKCLNSTIKFKPDFEPAYEQAGLIYYQNRIYPLAKDYLEMAIKLGSNNKGVIEPILESIKDEDTQFQTVYDKAINMLKEGNFATAMLIFDFFIQNNIRVDDINRNLGVYYLKNNAYAEAIKYFTRVTQSERSSRSYMELAYCYFKADQADAAISTLDEGLIIYPKDNNLKTLLAQVQKASKQFNSFR